MACHSADCTQNNVCNRAIMQAVSSTITSQPFLDVRIETIAGRMDGLPGHADGHALETSFTYPRQLSMFDKHTLLISDSGSHKIRRLDLTTRTVSTLAGTGKEAFADGDAAAAQFKSPMGVCVDPWRRVLIADQKNQCVRQLDQGKVKVVAGSAGHEGYANGLATTEATFGSPSHLAADAFGHVFITDSVNHCVRMLTPLGHTVESRRMAADAHIADSELIDEEVSSSDHQCEVSTVVGITSPPTRGKSNAGSHTDGKLCHPGGIAIDGKDRLVIVNEQANTVVRVDPHNKEKIELLAGQYKQKGHRDDWDDQALFDGPMDVAIDDFQNIFVADRTNHSIRVILPHGEVLTLIGAPDRKGQADGAPEQARLCFPLAICYDIFSAHSGVPRLFIADSHRICALYYQVNADFVPPPRPQALPKPLGRGSNTFDSTQLVFNLGITPIPEGLASASSTPVSSPPSAATPKFEAPAQPVSYPTGAGAVLPRTDSTEFSLKTCFQPLSDPQMRSSWSNQSLSNMNLNNSIRVNSSGNLTAMARSSEKKSHLRYASNSSVMSEQLAAELHISSHGNVGQTRLSSIDPSPASSAHATPAGSPRRSPFPAESAAAATPDAIGEAHSANAAANDTSLAYHASNNDLMVSSSSIVVSSSEIEVAHVRRPPNRRETVLGTVFDQVDKNAARENAKLWTHVADENLHPRESHISKSSKTTSACCLLM